MIRYEQAREAKVIPVISLGASTGLSETSAIEAAARIRRAACETGFFYVADHGVPDRVIAGAIERSDAFFAQPQADKDAVDIAQSLVMRGYERLGAQTLDDGSAPDLKESFMIGRELGPDHPWVREGLPYEGVNQWPENLPDFRPALETYLDEMITLGRRIASLLARSLDLPVDYFAQALEEPSCSVRMLSYPPQEEVKENQIGCGAHTDWGFITILLQDDVGGLEIENVRGEWVMARPIPGSFVVNLGDMMPRLTAGLYKSTPHRVRNAALHQSRRSIATFFNPPPCYEIRCLPGHVHAHGKVIEPITFADHLRERFETTYRAIG